jgi:hypothetical protein
MTCSGVSWHVQRVHGRQCSRTMGIDWSLCWCGQVSIDTHAGVAKRKPARIAAQGQVSIVFGEAAVGER